MYNNWLGDQNDKSELAKNTAYLLASFWNPEAVKQILGEGNVHESSDEEYEESLDIVRNQKFSLNLPKINEDEIQVPVKRRRRPIVK